MAIYFMKTHKLMKRMFAAVGLDVRAFPPSCQAKRRKPS